MAIICLNTSLIYFQYVRFICTYPRAMCICPTGKADEYFQKDFSRYREELRYLFEVYDDGEVETLYRLLTRLYAGIENLERGTCHEER